MACHARAVLATAEPAQILVSRFYAQRRWHTQLAQACSDLEMHAHMGGRRYFSCLARLYSAVRELTEMLKMVLVDLRVVVT